MKLRYYQRDAIDAAQCGWMEYRREVGQAPTGSGKTPIAAGLIEVCEGRTLYLADANELVTQPLRAIRQFTGIIPALEQAENFANLESRVVVASAQTLIKEARLHRFRPDHFDQIISDECHRGTERDIAIADYFETANVLGMTATPYRKRLRDLSKWYEHVCFQMTMLDLAKQGFAPRFRVMPLAIEIDMDRAETIGAEYKPEDLHTLIRPYYEAVCDQIKEHASDRHIVAFCPLRSSSREFAEILRANGIAARHVEGESEDREQILEGFAKGDFQVITNSQMLSVGWDCPIADCLLNLSPTSSMSLYLQRIGRITRVLPGTIDDLPEKHQAEERLARIAASTKRDALVLDPILQHDRMDIINAGVIFANDKETANANWELIKKLMSPEELEQIAIRVQQDREAKLVQRMEEAAAKKGKRLFDADSVAHILNDRELMRYEPRSFSELREPTEPQRTLLQRFGIRPESIEFSGMATQLISILLPRAKRKMATLAQVALLKKLRLVDPHDLTIKQAAQAIDELLTKRRGARDL